MGGAHKMTIKDDAAEKLRTEQLLKESELRLRLTTQGGKIGLWDWKVQTGETVFNEQWASILGYTLSELEPISIDTWARLAHPDDLNRSSELLEQHFNGELDYYEIEARMMHKNGNWIWVLDRGEVVEWDPNGKPVRMVGTHININERRMIEAELEASRRNAENANELKSQFIASMSHEIRTPMNAILGYTALLNELIKDEKGKRYIRSIQRAGNTLVELINDILDISKLEVGEMAIQTGQFSIRNLMEEIQSVFMWSVESKGIELNVAVDPEIPELLLLDDLRIRQIVFNLVGNAVKFTGNGGIEVAASVMDPSESSDIITLKIAIRDTGIGIPEDQQKSIFEPFKQMDGQSNKKYGGTGLGLSISKRLAEVMGGSITLISDPGLGSTFTLVLPDVVVFDRQSPSESSDPSVGKSVKAVLFQEGLPVRNPETSGATMRWPEPGVDKRIVEELEPLIDGLWGTCSQGNRISDVRELAARLTEIEKNRPCKALATYAEELMSSAKGYNAGRIRELLSEFPIMLAQFKQGYGKIASK